MPQFCSDLEAVGLNSQEMLDFQCVTGVIFAEVEVLKYDSQSLVLSACRTRYRQYPRDHGTKYHLQVLLPAS